MTITPPIDIDSLPPQCREDERELVQSTGTVPFDDRYHRNASLDDLSPRLIQQHLQDIGSDLLFEMSELPMDVIGRRMNIVGGCSGTLSPKNVGLLFFSERPYEFFPAAQIDVGWFPAGPGTGSFKAKEFRGPMAAILRDAVTYIDTCLMQTVVKHPHKPEAERFWNFPPAAVKEALVNAVCHRSYEVCEPITVRVTPREVLVLSYPGPSRAIQMADLRRGQAARHKCRNPRIGEFLKKLGFAEGRSTGVPKILRAMRNNGSPPPIFETHDDRTWFRVRLPAHRRLAPKQS